MKARKSRHTHHHYHYSFTPRSGCKGGPPGMIKRTIRGLADKFDVPKGLIIFCFVILFLMSVPMAIIIFLACNYWVKNPGKVENSIDEFVEKTRRTFDNMSEAAEFRGAQTATSGASHSMDDDLEFPHLKKQFEDLERRTADMEEHVASDEYQLNKDINDIK